MSRYSHKDPREVLELTKELIRVSRVLSRLSDEAVRSSRERVSRSYELLARTDRWNPPLIGLAPESNPEGPAPRWGASQTVVLIGGSAGSLSPLAQILSALPEGFPAAVLVVQHSIPTGWVPRASAEALGWETRLPTHTAAQAEFILPGNVYVCPPDHHLSIDKDRMRLDSSPKKHHTRPSIDVLFRSAAAAFGRFSIGVVLSGILRDGTSGLWHIKQRGGVAIVQDPLEAEFPGMPRSAIEQVAVDYVLPAAAIADKLLELARRNQASATRQSGPPEILIVEDEGLVAANIQEQLEELSYGVSGIARSGEEAMRNAAEKRPDLILMDVRLAGSMTGIEAARNIWERLQIPVVFITAHADLATLDNVSSTEHYGFVVKPFQSASLQAAVKLALDRRARELRHLPPRAES